jgi:hypothetical protein
MGFPSATSANGAVSATRERISTVALDECFGGRVVPAGTLLMSYRFDLVSVARGSLHISVSISSKLVMLQPVGQIVPVNHAGGQRYADYGLVVHRIPSEHAEPPDRALR